MSSMKEFFSLSKQSLLSPFEGEEGITVPDTKEKRYFPLNWIWNEPSQKAAIGTFEGRTTGQMGSTAENFLKIVRIW